MLRQTFGGNLVAHPPHHIAIRADEHNAYLAAKIGECGVLRHESPSRPNEIKGQAITAFVTVKEGVSQTRELEGELKEHVVRKIGAIARPDQIMFSADLPKTRSGKIMRRLLRDIAEGRILGDTTTLADASVIESLKRQYEEKEES